MFCALSPQTRAARIHRYDVFLVIDKGSEPFDKSVRFCVNAKYVRFVLASVRSAYDCWLNSEKRLLATPSLDVCVFTGFPRAHSVWFVKIPGDSN